MVVPSITSAIELLYSDDHKRCQTVLALHTPAIELLYSDDHKRCQTVLALHTKHKNTNKFICVFVNKLSTY
jgi:hypothetical protein